MYVESSRDISDTFSCEGVCFIWGYSVQFTAILYLPWTFKSSSFIQSKITKHVFPSVQHMTTSVAGTLRRIKVHKKYHWRGEKPSEEQYRRVILPRKNTVKDMIHTGEETRDVTENHNICVANYFQWNVAKSHSKSCYMMSQRTYLNI